MKKKGTTYFYFKKKKEREKRKKRKGSPFNRIQKLENCKLTFFCYTKLKDLQYYMQITLLILIKDVTTNVLLKY